MKDLFKHILEIDEVKGLYFFYRDGGLMFHQVDADWRARLNGQQSDALFGTAEGWNAFLNDFYGVQEAELVFENIRLYFRRVETGVVFILLDPYATAAMARLNLDIAVPALNKAKKTKGLGRLFRRR
ncbi:MAG: hypothetical protein CSA22_01570 [Deltaproteobacteria bacterium]|nr:MAG: hypothetical protein CSA22_01570 [Deltaproteobacteria bacterium]